MKIMKPLVLRFPVPGRLLGAVALRLPLPHRTLKYANLLVNRGEAAAGVLSLKSRPVNVRIAPVSFCNYRCRFCEIHKDEAMYPRRSHNILALEDIDTFTPALRAAYAVEFYGGSAEPLLNPRFGEIAAMLKRRYGMRLMANTNASRLTPELGETLIRCGFDHLLVSYHAATPESYRWLMTGNIEKVDRNLRALAEMKRVQRGRRPEVLFNFALHRLNAPECEVVVDKSKALGVDGVLVSKYYGGRNLLQDGEVSFDYDPTAGNAALDRMYMHARQQGVRLVPKLPPHWPTHAGPGADWDENEVNVGCRCDSPWTALHFDPVLDEADCYYVGVCNRAHLFKLRYRHPALPGALWLEELWNHPMLRHLRATVNTGEPNSLCRYCKNHGRERLRNTRPNEYARIRDHAVPEFLAPFAGRGAPTGWYDTLTENPFADERFRRTAGKARCGLTL